ncbi:MAG: hypothetical protein FGM30_05710, partial [Candidatus Fonsibacter sp.]|nr:hypothetical protein [Candidatus Fonsibacter sp.]
MSDIETFFNTSSFVDFQIEVEADPKLLDAIKNNKNLLVRFNATDFHQKFLYLLDKDVNPFELYLTIRTFDIKNYLDILINFYSERNNLTALCQIINNLKGSDTMTFWCVLQ